jgi:hypothetical protein
LLKLRVVGVLVASTLQQSVRPLQSLVLVNPRFSQHGGIIAANPRRARRRLGRFGDHTHSGGNIGLTRRFGMLVGHRGSDSRMSQARLHFGHRPTGTRGHRGAEMTKVMDSHVVTTGFFARI